MFKRYCTLSNAWWVATCWLVIPLAVAAVTSSWFAVWSNRTIFWFWVRVPTRIRTGEWPRVEW